MITKRQKEVLDFIKSHKHSKGYSPSLEDIRDHLKVASVSTAHHHIKKLQEAGYLDKESNQPRAINIRKGNEMIDIPLRGLIVAGNPIEAIEEHEILSVPKNNLSESKEHFALRVKGDSMLQEGIFDGDYVIIRKQSNFENGETIIALINNNEATLKKIYRVKEGFKLQPANPLFKPLIVRNLIIQGKVISVMRSYEEKRNINRKINLASFVNELRLLLIESKKQITKQFSGNKEYNIWSKNELNSSKEKFFLETAYTLFNELIILWVCRDKGLLDFKAIQNYQESKKLKEKAQKIYSHIFESNIFSWYKPTNLMLQKINNMFNKYDFSEIDRDILGKLYEQFISQKERKRLGQFYTPEIIIDYILNQVGYTSNNNISNKKIIDISCGSGGFITRATFRLIAHLKNKKYTPQQIIESITNNIYGLDINPFACYLAETNILLQFLDLIVEAKIKNKAYLIPKINIFQTNTIESPNLLSNESKIIQEIKTRTGKFSNGFDFVVGNPPYLEAKKMDKTIKLLCTETCPNIAKGAFDLFICFIDQGLKLLKRNNCLGYIIPNKFLIANYAKKMREQILEKYLLKEIIDVSECEIFKNVSVYPIILILKNQRPNNSTITKTADRILSIQELENNIFCKSGIEQQTYKRDDFVFFILPAEKNKNNLLKKLLSNNFTTIDHYLTLKWTISFHASGLRDKFIFSKKPKSKFARKLIGGKSFSGNQEINRFNLKWNGWWINYNEKLAQKYKNPIPSQNIFNQEKIIICQNALRLRATYDNKNFFCKDTFFIGFLKNKVSKLNLHFFLAIMNSKLLHYYYANIYKGTHIAGGYLHYLIGYLNSLPVAEPTKKQEKDIVALVNNLLKNTNHSNFSQTDKILDNKIYELYNLNDEEIKIVEDFI